MYKTKYNDFEEFKSIVSVTIGNVVYKENLLTQQLRDFLTCELYFVDESQTIKERLNTIASVIGYKTTLKAVRDLIELGSTTYAEKDLGQIKVKSLLARR